MLILYTWLAYSINVTTIHNNFKAIFSGLDIFISLNNVKKASDINKLPQKVTQQNLTSNFILWDEKASIMQNKSTDELKFKKDENVFCCKFSVAL